MVRNSMSAGTTIDPWLVLPLRAGMILVIVLMACSRLSAYSVLTHEEIVDLLWTDQIQPLLLKRFPGLAKDQITEAHAYAYGGAVIQDLGTIHSGGGSLAIWRTMCGAAIWFWSYCVKAKTSMSTRSR